MSLSRSSAAPLPLGPKLGGHLSCSALALCAFRVGALPRHTHARLTQCAGWPPSPLHSWALRLRLPSHSQWKLRPAGLDTVGFASGGCWLPFFCILLVHYMISQFVFLMCYHNQLIFDGYCLLYTLNTTIYKLAYFLGAWSVCLPHRHKSVL